MTPLVIIAHAGDALAARVHLRLKRRLGAAFSRLVPAEQLGMAVSWEHGLHNGRAGARLRLGSGLVLGEEAPFLLFNRIRQALMPRFQRADAYDRTYAGAEMHALLLSWLHSLGERVVNQPFPPDLAGRRLSRIEALDAAARTGLPCASLSFSTTPRVFPVEDAYRFRHLATGEAIGGPDLVPAAPFGTGNHPTLVCDCQLAREVPVTVAGQYRGRHDIPLPPDGLLRLQKITGMPVMELRLAPHREGGWRLSHLNAFPEQADDETAAIVAAYLMERVAEIDSRWA